MTSHSSSTTPTRCHRCGSAVNGPFCAQCGAATGQSNCTNCNAQLSTGAKFCHRCGTSATATAGTTAASPQAPRLTQTAQQRDPLPWAVAAIALVALIALLAGQKFGASRMAPASPPPQATRAPDISGLTPREMTNRLFDRVMTLHEAGLQDSANFLALTMAIPAFDWHDSLDADLRYDLGRIAEVTGATELARAQADSILLEQPTHLLGLILASNVARITGDTNRSNTLLIQLLNAERSERARNLPEYDIHKGDIDRALTLARQIRQ